MLTEKQLKFVENYCLTGNASKAAEMAGYSAKTAKQKGYELKNLLSKEIEEANKKMFQDKIPAAIARAGFLIDNANNEAVSLQAVKLVLEFGGLKPVEKQEISYVENASDEDLKRELEALGYKLQ